MPGAPSFPRREPGFGYMSSNSRKDCQEKKVPGWKGRLTALSWTAGKITLAEQEKEKVSSQNKSTGVVAPGTEGTRKSPAGMRHCSPVALPQG